MAEIHLDHPGEITWYAGAHPLPVLGHCRHACEHLSQRVIAWGPSEERYELASCTDCSCRAWLEARGKVVTPWLNVGGRRNSHCMNCGDERGGPVGHETSECRLTR